MMQQPKTWIFVATGDVLHKIYIGRDSFLHVRFEVSIDQMEQVSQAIYGRLISEGRERATIMAVHATEGGVIPGENHDAIARWKPDAIFTCYTAESRRLNAQYPIVGFCPRKLFIKYSTESKIVKIQES